MGGELLAVDFEGDKSGVGAEVGEGGAGDCGC